MQTLRVLVVDDDPGMAELISEQLSAWDFEPAAAGGVDEALALLSTRSFDLVLSDLHMPRKNGFELLRLVQESWSGTPVILFSSFPSVEAQRQALEGGARRFLSKPFALAALREAVESEVRRIPPP
ncbi:MAG TPA: response regulator [Myxococcota bacterium]|nr:response regulator [Myxococcota bacterium]